MKRFITIHFFLALLLISWFVPPTSLYWKYLDFKVFSSLNQSLENAPLWTVFWALANVRITDLFGAFLMLGFTLLYITDAEKEKRVERIAQLLFILFWFEIGISFSKSILYPFLKHWGLLRKSPAFFYPESIRLSTFVPWLPVKDFSNVSFPGDHALIVLQWAGFMAFFGGKKYGIPAFLFVIPFVLPRLISGAHWMTDIVMGSAVLATSIITFATATPLYRIVLTFFERTVTRCSSIRKKEPI